jgi:hypothetical protein
MSQHTRRFLRTLAIVVAFCLLILTGCEVPTSVKIHRGLFFSLNGSGRLASFRIYGPQPEYRIATPFDSKSLVWRVEPSGGYFEGMLVSQLNFQYGQVPSGYRQTVPLNGSVPSLSPGRVYYFLAETTNAPPDSGYFYMDGSTPVKIDVPGLCQSGFVGDVKPLKCGTNDPYVEPQDLKQFVKDHRVRQWFLGE